MINLLIVTHRFHPYSKVGARRWSKFVNYLQHQQNLKITVVTQQAKVKSNNTNPWNVFLKSSVDIISLSPAWFEFLADRIRFGKNLFVALDHKWRYFRKYTDEGYGFSQNAYKYINKNFAKFKVDVIIASVPAFSTAYFMAKLKQKYPQVKLILDFRDVWTDGFLSWNPHLTPQSPFYLKQIEFEKFSLKHCDALVSVTPEALEKISAKCPNQHRKERLLTNGYDELDLNNEEPAFPTIFNKEKINICHFGTLDFGRDLEFIKLVGDIKSNQLEWYCFGYFNDSTRKLAVEHSNVHLVDQLPYAALHQYFYHADYHLIINDREFYYAYGSKIFDALLYRKKVIYVSRFNSLVGKLKDYQGFIHTENDDFSNKRLLNELNKVPMKLNELTYKELNIEVISDDYYKLIEEVNESKY